MLILVAVMLVILLVMMAFSVDVAYMQLVRTELRTATDAASHAASEALVRTQDIAEARQAARTIAGLNPVAGEPLLLSDGDIVFGSAQATSGGIFRFTPGNNPVNAVRVNGRRTSLAPSGHVTLFMGGLLGRRHFEPVMTSTSTGLVRDIALVLDRSGSMGSEGKIDSLKSAVSIFLDILQATPSDERVSLATYSTTATKDMAMTSDLDAVRRVVQRLPADGYTAIGQGLRIGSDSLESDPNSRAFSEKAIVLMTDGIENRPPNVMTIVPTCVSRNQVVHTITFGSGADQGLMRLVASRTGGTHRHATTGSDLEEAFREIARTLAVVLID